MFEESGNKLQIIKNNFSENIRDNFGKSIENEVFNAISQQITSLEQIYQKAQIQIQEIKIKTQELRSIL